MIFKSIDYLPLIWIPVTSEPVLLLHLPISPLAPLPQLTHPLSWMPQWSLHFTWSTSSFSQVNFLDFSAHLDQGHSCNSVHIKSNNLQQYLHFFSCHNLSTKHSIPFSLAIQGWCIYSHLEELHIYTTNLTQSFLTRSYPSSLDTKKIPMPFSPNPIGLPTPAPLSSFTKLKHNLGEGLYILS